VPGHQIPLATFVQTSLQTEAVIAGLSRELFGGQLQFELFVLPPDEGSFLHRLGVVLAAGYAAILSFTESDLGKGIIKGLTDHEPAYWGEMVGKAAKNAIEQRLPPHPHKYETTIVSEAAKSFLQKPSYDLERIGITPDRFRDAFAAKNAFYEACDATPDLQAIGFSEAPAFPIRKEDFVRLQVALPPNADEAEHPWRVAKTTLYVTSPNWDRSDRTRKWKGRDKKGRERFFTMDDNEFWQRVGTSAVSSQGIDVMKVQWVFQGDQRKQGRVLRVLEFNGVPFAAPLSDGELLNELGRLAALHENDLFSDQ
jgi:hypothetical protein